MMVDISQPAAATKRWALLTLSGDQSTDLASTDHLEFDTIVTDPSGDISVTTGGSDQTDGTITLPAGDWEFEAKCDVVFSGGTGSLEYQLRDATGVALIGLIGTLKANDSTSSGSSSPGCKAVHQPSASNTYELEVGSVGALTSVQASGTYLFIREL